MPLCEHMHSPPQGCERTWRMLLMPRDMSMSTTLPMLVRWISGTVSSSSSFWKAHIVYSRKHFPSCVRPARPWKER